MKIKENVDVVNLIKAIKRCHQNVYFHTRDGDRLNLKSTLSQYLFSVAARDAAFLAGGKIECQDPEDDRLLETFFHTQK